MTDRCQFDVFGKAKGMLATFCEVMLVGLFCCCQLSDRSKDTNDARGYDPTARFRRDCQWKFWGPWSGTAPAALPHVSAP